MAVLSNCFTVAYSGKLMQKMICLLSFSENSLFCYCRLGVLYYTQQSAVHWTNLFKVTLHTFAGLITTLLLMC